MKEFMNLYSHYSMSWMNRRVRGPHVVVSHMCVVFHRSVSSSSREVSLIIYAMKFLRDNRSTGGRAVSFTFTMQQVVSLSHLVIISTTLWPLFAINFWCYWMVVVAVSFSLCILVPSVKLRSSIINSSKNFWHFFVKRRCTYHAAYLLYSDKFIIWRTSFSEFSREGPASDGLQRYLK